ncbi:hypothetical protein [uncultured Campylobacter sp.]|uniref:hypothetical protein n=1 Tax=uncultured Campylobacter sp. TaxID=218934 RepID=UPI0028E57E3F|nr:hypothetical protein [uncultured Campylobacter sp.]
MRNYEEFYSSLLEDFRKDVGELDDVIMADINNYLASELDAIKSACENNPYKTLDPRIMDIKRSIMYGQQDTVDIQTDIELVRILLGNEEAKNFKEQLNMLPEIDFGRRYKRLEIRKYMLDRCEQIWWQRCANKNLQSIPDILNEKIYELKLMYAICRPCKFRPQGFLQNHDPGDRIGKLTTFLNIIGSSNKLRQICEIIGRGEGIKNENITFSNSNSKLNNFKEQFGGIKISNEIENIVPSELAFLSEDLHIIFDMKFIEKKLLCFESQSEVKNINSGFKMPNVRQKGPVMLVVDGSYSMQEKENTAKSIAFLVATIAKREKRACYLVCFNTQIKAYDLSGHKWHDELMKFCLTKFDDGTNFKIAIKRALEHIKNDKNADVLVVSDALFDIDDEIRNISKNIKSNGSNLYAIILGDEGTVKLNEIFDKIWKL